MRILGLDYGTKRIGVAISDELELIAQPIETIPAQPVLKMHARLKTLLHHKPCRLIVVGLPKKMDGSIGDAVTNVKHFIKLLKKEFDIPIQTWDERLTSVLANRFLRQARVNRKKRKGKVDQIAAAILLQSFLDANQNANQNENPLS